MRWFRYTAELRDADWTKLLGWPGYRVWRQEIDEQGKRLKPWVRRKRGNKKMKPMRIDDYGNQEGMLTVSVLGPVPVILSDSICGILVLWGVKSA